MTRDRVRKFNVSGVHLGKDLVIPLPTLSVTKETSEEVAKACAMPLELIAAASNKEAADVYKLVDCHLTDSVAHNKHLSEKRVTCTIFRMRRDLDKFFAMSIAHLELCILHCSWLRPPGFRFLPWPAIWFFTFG